MFASPAFAQGAAGASPGAAGFLIQLVPLILLFVIFWFLIIRPQQKRLKEHREMVAAVKRGDEVVTGGGLIGRVSKVTDTEVEVELAPSVRVRAVKSTLQSVTPRGTPANDARAA
ncbi:preprotein translocase subunit YajC [Thermaurantiacus sp.]